jgi:catechol 2,3-dioxygenase-like lactoylglutathione lyase family enzyme
MSVSSNRGDGLRVYTAAMRILLLALACGSLGSAGEPKIQFHSPVLFVKDIKVSRAFYEGLLGQKVLGEAERYVMFAGFSVWQADYATKTVLGPAAAGLQKRETPSLPGFEIYFESPQLDEAFSKLAAAGVTVIHPVRKEPWGQRVFRVRDPDGHIVEVAEPFAAMLPNAAAN